ncbi:MAG: ATP-binding protein [Bacteroidota bacterium]
MTLFLVSCCLKKQLATPTSSSPPKKVAIVGPECTGKTDLSKYLAAYFKTEWVPEYARAYLDKLNRPYDQSDLTKIAHGQLRVEDEWMQNASRVLICDTNLIVLKVWSEEKFGTCDPEILKAMNSRHYDLLLLTNIDIPWKRILSVNIPISVNISGTSIRKKRPIRNYPPLKFQGNGRKKKESRRGN